MASIFGKRTVEEPAYILVQKAAEYEIREYAPQVRATVTMEGSSMERMMGPAFRALAGYIFGGNESRAAGSGQAQKIAMTAPVGMTTGPAGGGSGEAQKIAMTAPVGMTSQPGAEGTDKEEMTMTFTMPSKFKSVEELPMPKDPRVKLVQVPAHTMAVISFSWSLSQTRMREMEGRLRAAAARDGVKLSENPSDVVLMGYNPPWTLPWWKHNEVGIPVVDS